MAVRVMKRKLKFDFCAKDGEKLGDPGGVSRPGGRGNEIAVSDGFGHLQRSVDAAGGGDFGSASGIGAARFALEDVGGGEELCGVADRGDGFFAELKWRTISRTRELRRRYSGARPPGMTRASYDSGFMSSKVALSAKLWPRFSE